MSETQKKIKPVFTWAYADVYKQTLWISLGQSDRQLKNSLIKYGRNITPELAEEIAKDTTQRSSKHHGIFATSLGIKILRVYLPPDMTDPNFHGILAHEVLHASIDILRERGMDLCEESEEAYTYLHDFFITDIYRALVNK